MSLFLRFNPPTQDASHHQDCCILRRSQLLNLYSLLESWGRSKLFRCFPISVGRPLFLPYQIPHPSLAQFFRLWPTYSQWWFISPHSPEKRKTAGINGCLTFPRHPVIFSADDWDVQSHPQQSIWVPLPFSEGDWIPRDSILILENSWPILSQRHWPYEISRLKLFIRRWKFMAHENLPPMKKQGRAAYIASLDRKHFRPWKNQDGWKTTTSYVRA